MHQHVAAETGQTWVRYRRLPLANIDRFEGCGVHYAATAVESELCKGDEVAVVGGGNSAGQPAVYLSRLANHVHLLVRGDGLASSMSDYLIRRIEAAPERITVRLDTQCTASSYAGIAEQWLGASLQIQTVRFEVKERMP